MGTTRPGKCQFYFIVPTKCNRVVVLAVRRWQFIENTKRTVQSVKCDIFFPSSLALPHNSFGRRRSSFFCCAICLNSKFDSCNISQFLLCDRFFCIFKQLPSIEIHVCTCPALVYHMHRPNPVAERTDLAVCCYYCGRYTRCAPLIQLQHENYSLIQHFIQFFFSLFAALHLSAVVVISCPFFGSYSAGLVV